tara:strand:- start:1377 stop:2552 length:1176 start_codon:yes stop_codon:yes gene_type:complete
MYYLYLLLTFFVILLLITKIYIRIKFGFWAYQPVFHYHNLLYWIYPNGLINKHLPNINKFCNFYNIHTEEYNNCDKKTLKEVVELLRTYYYNNKSGKYLPTLESISSYFTGNNGKTFISRYNKYEFNELLAVMTSRPLNMSLKTSKTLKIYYVDYLCVHSQYRKKGIAPEIIQTHEYQQSHKNNSSQISLFKREGKITGIVPLTVYKSYQFVISDILPQVLPHDSMKLIEINKLNINLLALFIHSQKNKYDCLIIPDIGNIINLINNETYKVYGIIENNKLIACYFFKDSFMYYNENNSDKYDIKSVEFFASITNCHHDEIFIKGFSLALHTYSKKINFKLVTIENISNNNIILNYIFRQNLIIKIISPTAYFLYNYVTRPILSERAFILC